MNREALKKAIDNLSIQMIYLWSSELRFYNDFDPLIPNQEVIGKYGIATLSCQIKKTTEENGNEFKLLHFKVAAHIKFYKGPIPDELKHNPDQDELFNNLICAEINTVFAAEYLITCADDIPEEALHEFGRLNAPHQVWPYWREYCHSTCSRMSLPVILLPMLVINQNTEKD